MYCDFFIDEDFTIDKHEFENKVFQCVFQYLRRFDARIDLSSFIYREPSVEGDYSTCISTIKKCVFFIHMYVFLILVSILHTAVVIYFIHLGLSLHNLSDFCMCN